MLHSWYKNFVIYTASGDIRVPSSIPNNILDYYIKYEINKYEKS